MTQEFATETSALIEDPVLYDLLDGERPFYLELINDESASSLTSKISKIVNRGIRSIGDLAYGELTPTSGISESHKRDFLTAQKGAVHILKNLSSFLENSGFTLEECEGIRNIFLNHHIARPWLHIRESIKEIKLESEKESKIEVFIFEEFFASKSLKFFLGRYKKIVALKIDNFFPNPYLQAVSVPVYGHKTFYELIKSLIEAHLVAGQETAYGWMTEALISAFASRVVPGKPRGRQNETHRDNPLKEIDAYFRAPSGEIDLISLKAGPMTINDSAAIEMRNKFRSLIDDFKKPFDERKYTQALTEQGGTIRNVIYGVTYGRQKDLTNKPRIVKEGGEEVEIKVGKALWSHVSGHEDMYLIIIDGLREGYRRFETMYGVNLPKLLESKIDEIAKDAETKFGLETTDLTDPRFWRQLARGIFEEPDTNIP